MARLARVLSADIPFHVTQRGNARQYVFECDADRLVYLDLLRTHCRTQRLSLLGYCLMSNHVHLIVVPARPESLPQSLKHTHGRYATYFNARHAASGHVWQGRYYSCALDQSHLWAALRYAELNPVRARMVEVPEDYAWSSARAHCGLVAPPPWLDMRAFNTDWDTRRWREHLDRGESAEADAIRACTHTGRPLGSPDFVAELEKTLRRRLTPRRGGRPAKQKPDEAQEPLFRHALAARTSG
jgi:REP-associated tyrosine transposase